MLLMAIVIGLLGYYLYSLETDKPISVSIKNIIPDKKDTNKGEKETKQKEEKTTKKENVEKSERKYAKVTDYNEFFNIDNIINEYYEKVTKQNGEGLLDVYDQSYIKMHKITKKNINLYYDTEYQDISFFTKEIYAKGKNGTDYYFVKGETQKYNFIDEEIIEGTNVDFMIIVDTNNSTYSVYPLSNISSIYTYGSNYNVPSNKVIEDNDHNTYFEKNYTDYTISMYYVNYYMSILYMNTEKAYAMIGSATKAKYDDLEAFTNDLENIYTNILGVNFTGYNATGTNGTRTYSLNTPTGVNVKITEESIMDFTIDF